MLAVRILGSASLSESEEKGKDESSPRSIDPGKLGCSGAAPVHEEESPEVVASALSETKSVAATTDERDAMAVASGAIFEIKAGISGLCEFPTTWRMPGSAA